MALAGGENFAAGEALGAALGQDVFGVGRPDGAKGGGVGGCREVARDVRAQGCDADRGGDEEHDLAEDGAGHALELPGPFEVDPATGKPIEAQSAAVSPQEHGNGTSA